MEIKKDNLKTKLFYLAIILVIAILMFFLFKDIIIQIIRFTKANDKESLKVFMQSKGWFGYLSIIAIEALEMIVICIPAEFIQMPAGITFPPLIAILLCDIGVILGASAIYILVNKFKIKSNLIQKREQKIAQIEKQNAGVKTQILMYFLFVTPIIPFGAICYYASGKNISYRKYIFTVATGVLPSIITSIIMGESVKYFIANSLPLWLLILIIIGLGAILFILMAIISKKYFFKNEYKNTPNHFIYSPMMFIFGIFCKLNSKPNFVYDKLYEEMLEIDGPIIFLCNHKSVYDIYYTLKYIYPLRCALVGNRYYTRNKFTRYLMKSLGFIPKRMFTLEFEPIKNIIQTIKNGTNVFIYPEARLTLDGLDNPITPGTESLIKKLKVPTVILNVNGDYFAYSKYRKGKGRTKVQVKVNKILYPEEIEKLDKNEISNIIQNGIKTNEYDYLKTISLKHKDMALNLEQVIYKCPSCRKDYTLKTDNNTIFCNCGFNLTFNNHFSFEKNIYNYSNISDLYRDIKNIEKEEVFNNPSIVKYLDNVNVVVMSFEGKKHDKFGSGTVTISTNGFTFNGVVDNTPISFSHNLKELQALAFGVNTEYECYYMNELYYFYPKENALSVVKASTIYDIIQEANN